MRDVIYFLLHHGKVFATKCKKSTRRATLRMYHSVAAPLLQLLDLSELAVRHLWRASSPDTPLRATGQKARRCWRTSR